MCDGKKIRDDSKNSKLKGLVKELKTPDHRLILHAKNTGSWLNIQGNTLTVTVIAATEFCGVVPTL